MKDVLKMKDDVDYVKNDLKELKSGVNQVTGK